MQSAKLTFEEALVRFANERDARPLTKLLGDKPIQRILEAALSSAKSEKLVSAIAIPSTIVAMGGALAYIKERETKPLLAFAIGLAGLWPFLNNRTHRTEPTRQQLIDVATLKQRRFVTAALEFQEALADGSIKAFEKLTPHSRSTAYRQIDPSMFRADHALAAIIGGSEYWRCVKVRTSLKHMLPTTDLYFEIGSARARPYLTGKLLIDLPLAKYRIARRAIEDRFPKDRVIANCLDGIDRMRALDPQVYGSAEDKATKVHGRADHARTLTMLAEGQLEHFENRLRLVDIDGLG
jgi:hypothetical protein